MWRQDRRLERDLARWRAAGWVTAEGETAIRAEIAARRPMFGLSGALAVLGAVLLGFAAMSFVAANWQEMSKLARLLLLATGLVGAYGGAGLLFARGLQPFGHAALLLGVAIFGASIMLIAQMYHMEGNPPDAVLTWALGAFGTGALVGSNPSLGAALVLAGLWSGWETAVTGGVHLWFVPAAVAIGAVMAARGWEQGVKAVGLALAVWVVALGYLLNDGHAHQLVVVIGLSVAAAGVALTRADLAPLAVRMPVDAATLVGLGVGTAFAGAYAMQFIETTSLVSLVLLAVLTLGALMAVIAWGARTGHRGILWLGYAAFSVEVLGIYFKTIGTLFGSSLFFLATGIVVLMLAALAWRINERTQIAGGGR